MTVEPPVPGGPDARLEELFDALRAPGHDSELAGEADVVHLMANAVAAQHPSKESTLMPPSTRLSRLPRVAAIAAVGVIGFGGVAAAATGTNPLGPVLADEPTVEIPLETTTTTSPTTVVEATTTVPTSEALGDGETDLVGDVDDGVVECPDDVANHGEAVSEVAHDDTLTGAAHGAAVSEMARSDCGKTADEDADENEGEEPEVTPATPSEVECPEGASNHGEAVSAVAKDKSHTGADHGKAVSEMARSDCGKPGSEE
jgi:hypothetical protein